MTFQFCIAQLLLLDSWLRFLLFLLLFCFIFFFFFIYLLIFFFFQRTSLPLRPPKKRTISFSFLSCFFFFCLKYDSSKKIRLFVIEVESSIRYIINYERERKKETRMIEKNCSSELSLFFHTGRTCAPPPPLLTRLRGLLSSQIDVLIHSAPMRPGRGYLVATWSWPRLDVDSGQDRPPFTFTCIYDTKCSSSTRGSYF